MAADECVHVWVLQRAVLDGAGAWREYACDRCGATAVQPASGDLLGDR